VQRLLIAIGLIILLAGLLWPWLVRLPLGRLPGDIVLHRPNLRVFVPLTSMIVVSLLASLVIWLLRR
jgi:hypothetical protein